ncbi:MAG: hypothetical protein INH41_06315 [Myxococcaceae bacterium]|jgi:hypothetical protein|nr:hypothetical protein [Myxococcaceae bacterium]MCA3012002.1 hypothetical protein [Myxococcaceae bacterium]
MDTDEETRVERLAGRLEAQVEAFRALSIVDGLDATQALGARLTAARARRDELAARVRRARAEVTAWRERTRARRQALEGGGERFQPVFTSLLRLGLRLALAVGSFCLAAHDGSPAAFALALAPVGVLWVFLFAERDA